MSGQSAARIIALFLVLAFTTRPASAQGTTGSFTGTVKDSSGAVIPHVRVIASATESGITWATESNEAGIYNLAALPPAAYRLTAQAQGFKRVSTNVLTLEVNQVARVDLTLEIGAVSETVE